MARTAGLWALAIAMLLVAAVAARQDPDAWELRQNALQPPEQVMDAIGISPGMTVAEVGAGHGRYAVRMAERVGEAGKVYAEDIDAEALAYIRERCERDGIDNIETILGEVDDPLLPEGRCDVVYLINTYHHLDRPVELLHNILPALTDDGILVIIDHDPDKHPEAGSHSTPQNRLFDEAYRAGFALVRIETFLPWDNINIFRPRGRLAGGEDE